MNTKINDLRKFFQNICNKYNEKIIQRQRKLKFSHLLYFFLQINFSKSNYSNVNMLLKSNKVINVSKQAISKKRNNICSEYIKDIFDQLVCHIRNSKIVKKSNRFAIDGSKLSYNKCLSIEGFKLTHNKTYCKSLLSTLYDVDNKLPIDCVITKDFDERKATLNYLLNKLNPNDILIFDRGYFSEELIRCLIQKKIKFVIRMVKSSLLVKNLQTLKSNDELNIVYNSLMVRTIKYKINETDYYLCTNIFTINIHHLKNIYHKRWTIEEFYKTIKNELKGNKLNCNNLNKNLQNLYSQMIIDLLGRYLECIIEKYINKCKKNYQLSHKSSLDLLNYDVIYLLLFKKSNKKIINHLHNLKENIIYCKPNRHFKRIRITPTSKWYYYGITLNKKNHIVTINDFH